MVGGVWKTYDIYLWAQKGFRLSVCSLTSGVDHISDITTNIISVLPCLLSLN